VKIHTTFKTSDIGEKIKNILELAYNDEKNLQYELLMDSLGCSTAYNKLIIIC